MYIETTVNGSWLIYLSRMSPKKFWESLRVRAKRHHRSLQGELIVILEEAVQSKSLTVADFHRIVAESGVKTEPDSARMIWGDRDAR